MSNITLVTALYDIGRGDLEGMFSRSFSYYMECFKDILPIDLPMVIFTDNEEVENLAYKNRSGKKTCVNLVSKSRFRKNYYYQRVQKIRTDPNWYNQTYWLKDSPQASLELYNPLVMYKMHFMHECASQNFFNTSSILWIDAGISNMISIPNAFENFETYINKWISDKIFITAFKYRAKEAHGFLTAVLDDMAGTEVDIVTRATLWGGPVKLIKKITPAYTSVLNSTLSQGYMGTEENILTLLTYFYPQMFNIYMLNNGSLDSFFENYSKG